MTINSPPPSPPKKIEQNGVLYSGKIVLVISIFELKLMQNTNLPHQCLNIFTKIYMIWILQSLVFCECDYHCAKSARIQSYSGFHFQALGLNANQNNSECGHFFCRVHHVFSDGECIVSCVSENKNVHLRELSRGL